MSKRGQQTLHCNALADSTADNADSTACAADEDLVKTAFTDASNHCIQP